MGFAPLVVRSFHATCSDVTLCNLARYIHTQSNETFTDIEDKLTELATLLEYDVESPDAQVTFPDAKLLVEEVGACPAAFEEFLPSGSYDGFADPSPRVKNADIENDISEYDAYPTCDEIAGLAMARGAHVYQEQGRGGGTTHITTASGSKIIMQTLDKPWNHQDRVRKLKQLKLAGIRAAIEYSDPRRHCSWCLKFKMNV